MNQKVDGSATPKPLAITMGDPAGIGPEIIVQALLAQPEWMRQCVVVGDVGVIRRAAALFRRPGVPALPICEVSDWDDVALLPPRCVAVLQEGASLAPLAWGQVSARAGAIAGQCVLRAAEAALRGKVSGIVTAPLHKEALHAAGAPFDAFPGHTEMLQSTAAAFVRSVSLPVRMMLANDELRTVLVSIHVSLRKAIEAVTYEGVLETLLITHAALKRVLGRNPRIAVAGLNPHAGEGGLFGEEELRVIGPAIQAAQEQGVNAQGPFPPDTIFMRARNTPSKPSEFDVVVAMYHDQGLIPVKYLGVEQGVNVTLGLPFVRISPDHGTAFDIAGTGRASPDSLIAAIRMARQLAEASESSIA